MEHLSPIHAKQLIKDGLCLVCQDPLKPRDTRYNRHICQVCRNESEIMKLNEKMDLLIDAQKALEKRMDAQPASTTKEKPKKPVQSAKND